MAGTGTATELPAVQGVAAQPPQVAPRYHVRVRNEGRQGRPSWRFDLRKDGFVVDGPPNKRALVPFLPAPWDKRILANRRRYHQNYDFGLNECLADGMAPQLAADALKAWLVMSDEQPTEANAIEHGGPDETALLLAKAQPAILTAGGFSYRLVPCHGVDHKPKFQTIARKLKEIAEAQVASIKEQARVSAQAAIADARGEAEQVREEIAQLRAGMGNQPPPWVRNTGKAVHWSNMGSWEVELHVGINIREIVDTIDRWNSILVWHPIIQGPLIARAWVPVDIEGRYSFESIHMDAEAGNTVHLSTRRACMHLQGLPSMLNGAAALARLENAISRGMQVVNLNSPLAYEDFNRSYREQLPPAVRSILSNRAFVHNEVDRYPTIAAFLAARPAQASWNEVRTIREEAEETFTLPEAEGDLNL